MHRHSPTTPALCQVHHNAPRAGFSSSDAGAALEIALPVLDGAGAEILLEDATPIEAPHGWRMFRSDHWRAGYGVAPQSADLESATAQLYRQLFEATRGLQLYRIWNYVPAINGEAAGLENYAHFCRGRSLSFEREYGASFKTHLPAASAVGAAHGPLAVAFLAGTDPAHHFENPRQVPAFEYPAQYGPRPPSFARATSVAGTAGRRIFVSGTAAIRGHQTVAPNRLDEQLACMIENLALIGEVAGAGANLGADAGWTRAFKVYVRRSADFPAVKAELQRRLLRGGDAVHYLQADICRGPLLVEVEAVLSAD